MVTKNQHYVPQFLLRKWSSDRKSIALLRLKSEVFVRSASIAGQCSKRYIYGKDQALEESFSALELRVSSVLQGIIDGSSPASLQKQDLQLLHFFVAIQHQRTHQSIDRFESMVNTIFQTHIEIVRPECVEYARRCRISSNAPYAAPLVAAAVGWRAFQDLKIVCLINSTRTPFVISDQPVVVYNAQAENHLLHMERVSGTTGYLCVGFLLFLPISPCHCLLFYDGDSYALPSQRNGFVELDREDVSRLNDLQAATARDCLYTDKTEMSDVAVNHYSGEHQRYSRKYLSTDVKKGKWIKKADGDEIIVGFSGNEVRANMKPKFLRLVSRPDLRLYKGKVYPLRSVIIAAQLQEYGKRFDPRQHNKPIFLRD